MKNSYGLRSKAYKSESKLKAIKNQISQLQQDCAELVVEKEIGEDSSSCATSSDKEGDPELQLRAIIEGVQQIVIKEPAGNFEKCLLDTNLININTMPGTGAGTSREFIDSGGQNTNSNVVFSNEQFNFLLSSVVNTLKVGGASSNNLNNGGGNFLNCSSKFYGNKDESVLAFIDAIRAYKQGGNISDENAFRGIPMLLRGQAAVWWQGVKDSVATFEDAVSLLLNAYGIVMQPHAIYKEIFSKYQGDTKTDIFVSEIRALFAQLPRNDLSRKVQIDMVYGLLSLKLREKIKRDSIDSFDTLLRLARTEELFFEEKMLKSNVTSTTGSTSGATGYSKSYCTFCRIKGHSYENCRNKSKRKPDQSFSSKTHSESHSELGSQMFKSNSSYGAKPKADLVCYGCKKPGVIKSNCDNCSPKDGKHNNSSSQAKITSEASFSAFESYCELSSDSKLFLRNRPLINIGIGDKWGTAIVDTAAVRCIASESLARVISSKDLHMKEEQLAITLADGSKCMEDVFISDLDVYLKDRVIPTQFVIFKHKQPAQSLLGIDFITNAQLCFDFHNKLWKFVDSVESYELKFENSNQSSGTTCGIVESECTVSKYHLQSTEGLGLNEDEVNQVNKLLQTHEKVFSQGGEPTAFAKHCIETGTSKPISLAPYPITNSSKREFLKKEIERMLEEDIIEECESPWAAPLVLVPKPANDTFRLCVDYRELNNVTTSDKYPMPRIDDVLQLAKRTQYMSTLDLRSGYWQIGVNESDQNKTAFICALGLFKFKRMPFGLKNAPATFQRTIDKFKAVLQDVAVFAYLDDIIVLSGNFEQHLGDLKKIFDRLHTFGLKANREKCHFFCDEIKFLGHIITKGGLKPSSGKVDAISKMEKPRNIRHVKTFLQTCSWFRKFIPNFSDVARPLTDLLKKNASWVWKDNQNSAFLELKRLLISAPILQQADENKPYILRTDASNYALGAVLLQIDENNDEHPIEYASRLLLPAERNYNTTEREALAVVWALTKFRGYVDGNEVNVGTDHQALKWLLTLKTPSGRLARWVLLIQSYNVKVNYTPGKVNVIADTLSRPPCSENDTATCGICSVLFDMPSETPSNMRQLQLEDPNLKLIIDCFETLDHPDITNWTDRGYLMDQGILYRYVPDVDSEEAQLVIPLNSRLDIIKTYHSEATSGHYGIERTFYKIAAKYFWPGMRKSIADFIKLCVECQRYKPSNLKPSGLLRTPVLSQRFEVVSIDLFGPLPEAKTGHKWIFIVEDTATRWTELFALQSATAEDCAKVLISEILLRYGIPRRIISDNGVQFVSAIMQKVCFCFDIKQNLVPFYHPEANPVERKNRDLKTQLAILVKNDHTSWYEFLPAVRFALNSTRCSSTEQTPAYLTFGRELRCLADIKHDFRTIVQEDNFVPVITPYLQKLGNIFDQVRDIHEKAQDQRKKYADKSRRVNDKFEPGDLVLVQTPSHSNASKNITSKFCPRRDGPYCVKYQKSPSTYVVESLEGSFVGNYHVSVLHPYNGPPIEPNKPLRARNIQTFNRQVSHAKENDQLNSDLNSKLSEVLDVSLNNENVNNPIPTEIVKTKSGRLIKKPTRYPNNEK